MGIDLNWCIMCSRATTPTALYCSSRCMSVDRGPRSPPLLPSPLLIPLLQQQQPQQQQQQLLLQNYLSPSTSPVFHASPLSQLARPPYPDNNTHAKADPASITDQLPPPLLSLPSPSISPPLSPLGMKVSAGGNTCQHQHDGVCGGSVVDCYLALSFANRKPRSRNCSGSGA